MKIRKTTAISLALLLVLGALTGCAASYDSATMENFDAGMKTESASGELYGEVMLDDVAVSETVASSDGAQLSDQKLIKTFDLDAETEDLDALMVRLNEKVSELGGYVENQERYNGSAYSGYRYRNATMVIRIPADKVDQFITNVGEFTNIISQTSDLKNVTLTYVATESRVEALETEQDRLLELMEQAETMSDLLEIEARLTEVRYELESVTSQLKVLQNQVSYSTVNLYVSEVQEYTPVEEETFWQKVSSGFRDSLEELGEGFENVAVFLLAKFPYILLLCAAGGVTVLVVKLVTRTSKKNNTKNPPQS